MSPFRLSAVAILGPTASGKTALALELAQHCAVEVISLDSALVYREMDVGTAKPTAAEQAAVPHHLIDIRNPTESYSAADFAADARRLMGEIRARGAVPLLVGGTMMYYRILTAGLDELPAADADIRADIEAQAAAQGWPALHAQLERVDPVTAQRLALRDSQRIQRALEVYRITGEPLSALQGKAPQPSDVCLDVISLEPSDRSLLHKRIASRFEQMLNAGLVDEVKVLRQRWPDLNETMTSMRCVGYRQAWDMLEGRISPAELCDRGIFATRQLAKRQLTWLRSTPDRQVFDPFSAAGLSGALAAGRQACDRLLQFV